MYGKGVEKVDSPMAQQNLVDFVQAMPEKPGLIKLVHGETEARGSLADKLRNRA